MSDLFLRTISLLVIVGAAATGAPLPGFHYEGPDPGGWPRLLRCFGLEPQSQDQARVIVLPSSTRGNTDAWLRRMEGGVILILEGDSDVARAFGFPPAGRRTVRSLRDERAPALGIRWQKAETLTVLKPPTEARVFTRDRRSGAPVMAGFRRGAGAVLWLALPPGPQGFERFPFILQALTDLGLRPLFASRRLWAFLDLGLRPVIADMDAQAQRWRESGISVLHAAAWDFFEPGRRDEYLRRVIEACHRHGVLVYAWLELPHVSYEFWNSHPEWREKTATLKDAKIDWRRLMNLLNPDCRREVVAGLRGLMDRFDWDGVDLAELYFESTEGLSHPGQFTPMSPEVRSEVRGKLGFDPLELFTASKRDRAKMQAFLDYRVGLAARLEESWIEEVERMRDLKPDLDIVLTHVDDRFDTTMRERIGADAARVLKLLDRHEFTFIIEDPGTVWHLGPQRYAEIAARYRPLTPRQERLGVDINIVERDQVTFPTAKQAGGEVALLIRTASENFARVAYYAEATLFDVDWPLLSPAAAVVRHAERDGQKLVVETQFGVGVDLKGTLLESHAGVMIDGEIWPVADDQHAWIPAGRHVISSAADAPRFRVLDFNGELGSASVRADGVHLEYTSDSRAFAILDRKPARLTIDGREAGLDLSAERTLRLPRGRHEVVIGVE